MENQDYLLLGEAATSPAAARRFVASRVSTLGFHRLIDDVVLVVTELVTNAVVHARTESRVLLYVRHGRLRLEVRDENPVLPERRHASDHATTGRGLALVESLSASWGANPAPGGGKVVWADFDPLDPSLTISPLVGAA